MNVPPVQYAKSRDGTRIAYFRLGQGPPIVFASRPLGDANLYALEAPSVKRPAERLVELGWSAVLHDIRGVGSSERKVQDFSIEARASDLEAVCASLGLGQVAIAGTDAAAAACVILALRNPELISCLVLTNAWVRAFDRLELPAVRIFSANPDPGLLSFLNQLLADAVEGYDSTHARKLAEGMELSASPDVFIAIRDGVRNVDLGDLLPRVKAPTLVIHDGSRFSSFELCQEVAHSIPGAKLLRAHDLESQADKIDAFLRSVGYPRGASAEAPAGLSARELEVLRLLAAGKSNQQIADDLVISLNTVRSHVSNVFQKTGVSNRAQAAGYARDHGFA
jgi:DNA-binding CsgD family transcriptional regulator/pimeloyl-ACP methyl ester carboxylesterase